MVVVYMGSSIGYSLILYALHNVGLVVTYYNAGVHNLIKGTDFHWR